MLTYYAVKWMMNGKLKGENCKLGPKLYRTEGLAIGYNRRYIESGAMEVVKVEAKILEHFR